MALHGIVTSIITALVATLVPVVAIVVPVAAIGVPEVAVVLTTVVAGDVVVATLVTALVTLLALVSAFLPVIPAFAALGVGFALGRATVATTLVAGQGIGTRHSEHGAKEKRNGTFDHGGTSRRSKRVACRTACGWREDNADHGPELPLNPRFLNRETVQAGELRHVLFGCRSPARFREAE